MSTREQLIKEIDAFLALHGMAQSRFGVLALNDRGFMTRLRSGEHSPNSLTVDKVRAWMEAYKAPENPKRAASHAAA